MTGSVTRRWDNGFFWINGDDGKSYISHMNESRTRDIRKGRRVTFDDDGIRGENGKYPFAINVEREFKADHNETSGTWVAIAPAVRRIQPCIEWCKCSSCGAQFTIMTNYCGCCGVKMTKTEEMRALGQELFRELYGEKD